jgi:hypothetical protein
LNPTVVNVVLPVLVRLNFFRQQVQWSRAMKSMNVQRLQALATGGENNTARKSKERPSMMGKLFGGLPLESNNKIEHVNDAASEISSNSPGPSQGKQLQDNGDRDSNSVIEPGNIRKAVSSSSGMGSREFAQLMYRRSFRYNVLAIGLPVLPLIATGFGFEFGLAYNRGNCNGCYEELWFFLVVFATVGGVLNVSAYYAYQLRNSPDPLLMLHELKMLVLCASLPAGLGALLTAIDQYIGRPYDRGVFSWDWLVIFGLMLQFYWLCLHPLFVANRAASKVSGGVVDFRSILENPRASKLFAEHLVTVWAVENLKFWSQVEAFRSQYASFRNKKDANIVAWQTYCTFIRPGAVLDVNIPASSRDKIIAQFDTLVDEDPDLIKVTVPSTIFDVAQHEVFSLMEKDSFQRFLKTDAYKAFANENTVVDAASQRLVVVSDPLA